VTPTTSKIDIYKFYFCEKSETCIAVLLYVGSIMTKAKMPNVNDGLDTSQHKAVSLAG
jgi:hypothetical protein